MPLQAIIRFVGSQTGAYDTSDPFAMWAADAVINTCSDFEKSAPKNTAGKAAMYGMFGDTAMPEEIVTTMVGANLWATAAMSCLPPTARTHAHTRTHTHARAHTHTHTHTRTHAHTQHT